MLGDWTQRGLGCGSLPSETQHHTNTPNGDGECVKLTIAMTTLIQSTDLTKHYVLGDQTVHALAGVDVTILEGECVAIMGPSGSGKSTFMNLIGCLDRPTSGQLMLAGEDVSTMSNELLAATRNKRIGFVFQQFNLLPRQSAQENVMLPLLYSAVPAEQHKGMAAARLAQVGLGSRMEHRPMQLSGGQQQRVAIARALVNNPALLLADEPTGALDSRTSLEVMALFQQLHAQGQTVVLVTHEPEVAAFASRVIHFRDGKVQRDIAQIPRNAAHELELLGVPE
jgi:putative ABC transport system ATP-binding protein